MEDRHPTTLRQKLATMTQLTSDSISSVAAQENTGAEALFKLTDDDRRFIGSTLNCIDRQEIDRVKADCGDGLLFMLDMIHGYRTVYPIPLALASSFDCGLVRRIATASAAACRRAGVDVTFSPMCDLARDPRWGRVMEGYGEDIELACRMIAATVEGYHKGGLLSCIKHFISYSAPDGGREYNNAEISQNTLYESYLPLYMAAITGIDTEQYEAADLDGATRWQKMWRITLPSILPTVMVMFILSTGSTMTNGFDQIFNLQNAATRNVAEVLDIYIYRVTFQSSTDFGFSTAVSLFRSVVNMVLLVLADRVAKVLGGSGLFGEGGRREKRKH